MQIDLNWLKQVRVAARHDGRRIGRLQTGPRLLLASVIALAIDDLTDDGIDGYTAAVYLTGPLYKHHATLLGLSPDSLPVGVSSEMLNQRINAGPPHCRCNSDMTDAAASACSR